MAWIGFATVQKLLFLLDIVAAVASKKLFYAIE